MQVLNFCRNHLRCFWPCSHRWCTHFRCFKYDLAESIKPDPKWLIYYQITEAAEQERSCKTHLRAGASVSQPYYVQKDDRIWSRFRGTNQGKRPSAAMEGGIMLICGVSVFNKQQGVTIVKPIVFGNVARYFGKKREEDGHTHQWSVYVKPYRNEVRLPPSQVNIGLSGAVTSAMSPFCRICPRM